MTTAEGARTPALFLNAAPTRYDTTTIVIHWTTAVVVLALFASGWGMSLVSDGEAARQLLTLHRSIGVAVWTLTCLRVGWRLAGAPTPELPRRLPPIARLGARINEAALYGLLLLQPASGALQSLYRGKPFDLFLWQVPALLARDKAQVHYWHEIHERGAWLLAGLVALHAAAALFHALVLRDGVFQHMAPVSRRRPR
ncbi:MAG: cytochrome b [Phenylobacterium sp.]